MGRTRRRGAGVEPPVQRRDADRDADCSKTRRRSRSMLVMVQREVGERLAAGPGTKAYGAVSVKVAYYAAGAASSGIVPPTVFVPAPKVESALVRIDRHAGAARRRAVGGATVHAGASRVRAAAQDVAGCAARRARRPGGRGARGRGRHRRPSPGRDARRSSSGPRLAPCRRGRPNSSPGDEPGIST